MLTEHSGHDHFLHWISATGSSFGGEGSLTGEEAIGVAGTRVSMSTAANGEGAGRNLSAEEATAGCVAGREAGPESSDGLHWEDCGVYSGEVSCGLVPPSLGGLYGGKLVESTHDQQQCEFHS